MTWWQWLIAFAIVMVAGYFLAAIIVGRNE